MATNRILVELTVAMNISAMSVNESEWKIRKCSNGSAMVRRMHPAKRFCISMISSLALTR
jgi:hypothetical protein